MAIKTVGVLGCGLMGAGIAQVSAAAGFKTIVLEVNEDVAQEGPRPHREVPHRRRREGQGHRGARRRRRSATCPGTTKYADLKDCDLVIEAIVENVEVKKQAYAQVEAVVGAALPDRVEHLVAVHHRAGGGDQAPGQGRRAALLQSRAADEAGRGDPRAGHEPGDATTRCSPSRRRSARSRSPRPIAAASSSTACWCRICSTRSAASRKGSAPSRTSTRA